MHAGGSEGPAALFFYWYAPTAGPPDLTYRLWPWVNIGMLCCARFDFVCSGCERVGCKTFAARLSHALGAGAWVRVLARMSANAGDIPWLNKSICMKMFYFYLEFVCWCDRGENPRTTASGAGWHLFAFCFVWFCSVLFCCLCFQQY